MHILICMTGMLATLVAGQVDKSDGSDRMMERVFVYGSLQRGEPNHLHLEKRGDAAIFKGIGATAHPYPLVIASRYNIPFMLAARGNGMHVRGELYDVDEDTFRQLDVLERHPELYTRSKIAILHNDTETEAWAYLFHDFKPFMETLPYLESYSSLGPHGLRFVARENRTQGRDFSAEVKIGANDFALVNDSASFDVGPLNERRHLVFVYGTLKRRERNHDQMTDLSEGWSQLMAVANTKDEFPLVIATRYNIPFMLDSQGVGKLVDGEVYMVDDVMLKKLDEFEDVPIFYTREAINVTSKNTEETMQAWTYLLHNYRPDLLQKPLLTSYSTGSAHGLPYQEPEEITAASFEAMLSEVKKDQST